ncbi:MAG TPA: DinB family protein [Ktedonobacterales bacterium]
MPMPTPPPPGEEPTNESELYRYHLRRLITWYLEALDPLPAAAFAWRPPAAEANTLAAICAHAIASAEWWVLSCVGDGPLERDRDAEFAAASATWAALRPRFTRFLARAEARLAGMDSTQLAAISRHPAGDRMNRRCLTHTVEHLGLHLGHIEITTDWWRSLMRESMPG